MCRLFYMLFILYIYGRLIGCEYGDFISNVFKCFCMIFILRGLNGSD